VQSSLNPATLRQTLGLSEFLMVAGQTGFRGVELRLAAAAELAERQGMAGLRQRLSDAGLAVAGFGYPIPLRSTAVRWYYPSASSKAIP
jgi:sugar phosphate isomerase/epimerase